MTLAVPTASVAALDRCCAPYERRFSFWRGLETPTTRVFPAGTTSVQVSAGGCSCDLYSQPAADPAARLDKERAKLLAKGWSRTKVERALVARSDSAARGSPDGATEAEFKTLVSELMQQVGTVLLHAHFHGGNQNLNEVEPVAKATLALEEYLQSGFPPDTLVTLRR